MNQKQLIINNLTTRIVKRFLNDFYFPTPSDRAIELDLTKIKSKKFLYIYLTLITCIIPMHFFLSKIFNSPDTSRLFINKKTPLKVQSFLNLISIEIAS
jgi:hypothetical protein